MKQRKYVTFICLLCVCVFFTTFTSCSDTSEKEPVLPADNGYEKLAQVFENNAPATEMLQTADSILQEKSEPSADIYQNALITAMVTYDRKHASQIAAQYKTDNLRLAKESNLDFAVLETAATSTMMRMDASTAVFQEKIPDFFTLLSNVKDRPAHWIYAVSEVETVMQNYAIYHTFLQTIANHTTGSLQHAACALQGSMQKAAAMIAQEFVDFHDTDTRIGYYDECFFAKCFFSGHCVNEEAYATDRDFQMLVDTALTAITAIEETPATPIQGDDAWKKAYIDFLFENDCIYLTRCKLIHINNDNIPELLIIQNAEGSQILCSYDNNQVISLHLWNLHYIEGQNLFLDSGGRMDYYYDIVYSMEDGAFVKQHSGLFGLIDAEYPLVDRTYEYYWNDTLVSEQEYKQLLHTAVDDRLAKTHTYDSSDQFGEIAKEIILY